MSKLYIYTLWIWLIRHLFTFHCLYARIHGTFGVFEALVSCSSRKTISLHLNWGRYYSYLHCALCTFYCNGIIAKYLLNVYHVSPISYTIVCHTNIPFSVIEKYKKMDINGKLWYYVNLIFQWPNVRYIYRLQCLPSAKWEMSGYRMRNSVLGWPGWRAIQKKHFALCATKTSMLSYPPSRGIR